MPSHLPSRPNFSLSRSLVLLLPTCLSRSSQSTCRPPVDSTPGTHQLRGKGLMTPEPGCNHGVYSPLEEEDCRDGGSSRTAGGAGGGAGMRQPGFLPFLPPLSFPQADRCFSVGSELSVHTAQQQRLLSLAVDTAGCPDPEAVCACGPSAAPPTTLRGGCCLGLSGNHPTCKVIALTWLGHGSAEPSPAQSLALCPLLPPSPFLSELPLSSHIPLSEEPGRALHLGNVTQHAPVPLARTSLLPYPVHLLLTVHLPFQGRRLLLFASAPVLGID